MIANPQNGKRERIYVNLEAVYPTPEEPGTELSFEELWAANRGWLDACWDEESLLECQHEVADENTPPVEALSRKVEQKLIIHRDTVPLDENGAIIDKNVHILYCLFVRHYLPPPFLFHALEFDSH